MSHRSRRSFRPYLLLLAAVLLLGSHCPPGDGPEDLYAPDLLITGATRDGFDDGFPRYTVDDFGPSTTDERIVDVTIQYPCSFLRLEVDGHQVDSGGRNINGWSVKTIEEPADCVDRDPDPDQTRWEWATPRQDRYEFRPEFEGTLPVVYTAYGFGGAQRGEFETSIRLAAPCADRITDLQVDGRRFQNVCRNRTLDFDWTWNPPTTWGQREARICWRNGPSWHCESVEGTRHWMKLTKPGDYLVEVTPKDAPYCGDTVDVGVDACTSGIAQTAIVARFCTSWGTTFNAGFYRRDFSHPKGSGDVGHRCEALDASGCCTVRYTVDPGETGWWLVSGQDNQMHTHPWPEKGCTTAYCRVHVGREQTVYVQFYGSPTKGHGMICRPVEDRYCPPGDPQPPCC